MLLQISEAEGCVKVVIEDCVSVWCVLNLICRPSAPLVTYSLSVFIVVVALVCTGG